MEALKDNTIERNYFLARLGTSNYWVHGKEWSTKLPERLEAIKTHYNIPVSEVHTVCVSIAKGRELGEEINNTLGKHVEYSTLLVIDTADPVLEIMSKYDGETIDPTYVPPEPEIGYSSDLDDDFLLD